MISLFLGLPMRSDTYHPSPISSPLENGHCRVSLQPLLRPQMAISTAPSDLLAEGKESESVYRTQLTLTSRIITATTQIIWHVLDQNMTSLQALSQPRLHDQLVPNQVSFEYAYDNSTVAFMASRYVTRLSCQLNSSLTIQTEVIMLPGSHQVKVPRRH